MKARKVWAVSSGSYSDYRVRCVVEGGKSEAEAVAAKMRRRSDVGWNLDIFVESFEVAAAEVEPVEVLFLSVTIWDDGKVTEATENVRAEWPFDGDAPAVSWRWVRAPIHDNKGGRLDVHGTDHERVRRTFSDRRAELMADHAARSRREAKGSR